MSTSVFSSFDRKAWPYRFHGTLHVANIAGGTPTDANVAEGWIKTKVQPSDDILRELVASTMVERGISAEEAVEQVAANKHLNGFKRDAEQGLYIEGRQLKAAIKEAANVAVASGKLPSRGWGATNKGLMSFIAEHVMVVEDRLYLGTHEASGIVQRFVHTFRGTGIQYEENVEDAKIDFTVISDHKFTDEQWAMLWLTGEQQGIGASRSQGYGRYSVVRWDKAK